MKTAPSPAASAQRSGTPGAAEQYVLADARPELERLPYWQEASAVIRESCRVGADALFRSPVLVLFTLLLVILMQVRVSGLVLGSYRQMLGNLVFDADGRFVGTVAQVAASAAARSASPCAALDIVAVALRPAQPRQPARRPISRPAQPAAPVTLRTRPPSTARDGPSHPPPRAIHGPEPPPASATHPPAATGAARPERVTISIR
jgi:hypothetical protein